MSSRSYRIKVLIIYIILVPVRIQNIKLHLLAGTVRIIK